MKYNTFSFEGKRYNSEQFGNISYGYTGYHLLMSYEVLLCGSIWANPKGGWRADRGDWKYISIGYIESAYISAGRFGKKFASDDVNDIYPVYYKNGPNPVVYDAISEVASRFSGRRKK